ncbi:hypothetical protein HanIR_Chr13g0619521 [Helianthus annuus]|nr:hypothetical protein HanIR_Chr13g0619521 [Helianthus annuus]
MVSTRTGLGAPLYRSWVHQERLLWMGFWYMGFLSHTVPGNTIRLVLLSFFFSSGSKRLKPKLLVHVSTKSGMADSTSFSIFNDFSS